jgi:hypothetical protein
MGLGDFDYVKGDAHGLPIHFEVDGYCNECPMVGRGPRIRGKVELAIIFLWYVNGLFSFRFV